MASARPFGGLHDLADQGAGRGCLAVADLGGDVRVGGDRRVDRLEQGASSLTMARPCASMTASGSPSPARTRVEYLAGELVVQRAACDQLADPGDLGWRDRAAQTARRRSRWRGGLARPATTCGRRPATRRPQRSPRRGRARRRSCSAVMSRSVRPHSAWSRARRAAGSSGRLARISSTQSAGGAIGTRSGSGK